MIHHLFFNFHQMKLSDIAAENYITEGTKNWYTKDQLTTKETTRKVPNFPKKRMHGITTQIIQLPKSKAFLLLPLLDNKQQIQI